MKYFRQNFTIRILGRVVSTLRWWRGFKFPLRRADEISKKAKQLLTCVVNIYSYQWFKDFIFLPFRIDQRTLSERSSGWGRFLRGRLRSWRKTKRCWPTTRKRYVDSINICRTGCYFYLITPPSPQIRMVRWPKLPLAVKRLSKTRLRG